MSETWQAVLVVAAVSVVYLAVVVGVQIVRYRLWLRRFRREWKIEREQWFKEHQECCDLDETFLAQPYG